MNDPLGDWISVTKLWGADLTMCRGAEADDLERDAVDAVAFVLVVEGSIIIEVGGARDALNAGEVALLVEGTAHRIMSTSTEHPPTLLLGNYEGSRCPVTSLWAGHENIIHVDNAAAENTPELGMISSLLVTELSQKRAGAEPMVGGLLDSLIVAILRAAIHTPASGSWLRGVKDPIVGAALDSIHREPSHPWTISELAKQCGVSRSLFSKRFTECMDESPMQYVRRWRMSLATRLMRDESLELEEIANLVGYTSQYAFSRAFKDVTGSPPGQFRRSIIL